MSLYGFVISTRQNFAAPPALRSMIVIVQRWGGGKITKAAVTEAVRLACGALLRGDGQLASLPSAA